MFENLTSKSAAYHKVEDHHEPRSSSETEEGLLLSSQGTYHRRHPFLRPWAVACILIFVALYSFLLILGTLEVARKDRIHGTRYMKNPVSDFITYEDRVFRQEEFPNPVTYFTTPSPEVDMNWHKLVAPNNLAIAPELVEEMGRADQGIKLPDGSYYGSLVVFHHLHCLKTIYHALHPEYYHLNNLDPEEEKANNFHTEHCLHTLKEAVMCQGDTTILTMKWGKKSAVPIGNFSSPHECVNWDRLMEWVVPHAVDVEAEGVLVHPDFGPVFKNGEFVHHD